MLGGDFWIEIYPKTFGKKIILPAVLGIFSINVGRKRGLGHIYIYAF